MTEKEKVIYDYIKSNQFRVLHVDGLDASITPDLDIQAVIWNERASIPQRLVFELDEDNETTSFVPEESKNRDSFVREVEACFTMSVETAEYFVGLLQRRIDAIKEDLSVEETE